MTPVEQWLASGQPALIAGKSLRPRTHPHLPVPLQVTRGQGSTYWLDSDNACWLLKSFLPARRPQRQYVNDVANCIARVPGFRCGWERRVLSSNDLNTAAETFASDELADWLNGTILMPQHRGQAWGDLLTEVAEGRIQLSDSQRIAIARQLVEAVLILETLDVSHRDLSSGNVLIDLNDEHGLSFIDWDTLYHPMLGFQTNTTLGTPGYIAPWLEGDGRRSWQCHADRFALAICLGEILTVRQGAELYGDGSLFDQPQLGKTAAALGSTVTALKATSPKLASLFRTAWEARSFTACPSPAEWLKELDSVGANLSVEGQLKLNGAPTPYRRWATLISRVRTDLHEGELVDADELAMQHPDLKPMLTIGLRWLFDQDRTFVQAMVTLRQALTHGDDFQIVQAVGVPGLDRTRLRASEVRQIEQAEIRTQALTALRTAIDREPIDDGGIVDAWWRALRAGCTIPHPVMTAARGAYRRQLRLVKEHAVQEFDEAGTPTTFHSILPREETPAHVPVTDSCDVKRLKALGELESASARGDDRAILAAAQALREAGERIPAAAWDAVAAAEARVSGLEELRVALLGGDSERTALAWARARTLWPDGMTPEEADAGQDAFRQWGRMSRQPEPTVGVES